MSWRDIIDSLQIENVVGKFKKSLKDSGVEIAEDPVAKYFAAKTENLTLLLFAHEPNLSKGW